MVAFWRNVYVVPATRLMRNQSLSVGLSKLPLVVPPMATSAVVLVSPGMSSARARPSLNPNST